MHVVCNMCNQSKNVITTKTYFEYMYTTLRFYKKLIN